MEWGTTFVLNHRGTLYRVSWFNRKLLLLDLWCENGSKCGIGMDCPVLYYTILGPCLLRHGRHQEEDDQGSHQIKLF